MANIVATPARPYTTPCDNPSQPCPECGGLECLCRPRFFAGQLLTDQDLNLLSHYIIEKNKLHNRYLHGWGVVCGLEVVCDPCSGVVVQPGYALSPCGEDIIVCSKQSVDVCSLINACKKPTNNCNPIDAYTTNDNCQDTTEEWVLAIRYHEKATRGVTSLRGASGSSCCSKCSCGGSSNCGCGSQTASQSLSKSSGGCGGGGTSSTSTSSNASMSASTRTTQTPAQCEPTAICEGFVFEVCKLPATAGTQAPVSPLIERMQCCLTLLTTSIPPLPANPTGQNLQNWCCALRENLAELFAAHPGHACQLTSQLGTLCQGAANQTVVDIAKAAAVYLIQFLRDCICSALLPPCPAPVNDDRIFLATITVSRKNCTILGICNWDQRKFAVGFPTLAYWLSPLHLGADIKNLIEKICCVAPAVNPKISGFDPNAAVRFQTTQYPITAQQRSVALGNVVAESYSKSQPVGIDTLALANMGALDANQQPLLTDAEMQMPMETLLLNQIVQPLLGNLAALSGVSNLFAGAAAEPSDVEAMKAQMAAMKASIDGQAKTIADLSARLEKQ